VAVIAEMRGQGLAMDADAYNIAINKLTQRDLAAAEALLVKMTNANVMPNAKTMDYFLRGFASQGEGAAGVSMVQSCFNMYQVRPSQDTFMRVVEKFGKVYMYNAEQGALPALFCLFFFGLFFVLYFNFWLNFHVPCGHVSGEASPRGAAGVLRIQAAVARRRGAVLERCELVVHGPL
jgi:hypothetical protein